MYLHGSLPSSGARNDLVAVEVQQCEGSVEITCRLLSGFVGTSHCEIVYGTDPTRAYLPSVDTSENVGTGGDVITVKLSQPLETNATYYYNLTTTHVNTAVRVFGTFRTGNLILASEQIRHALAATVSNALNIDLNFELSHFVTFYSSPLQIFC